MWSVAVAGGVLGVLLVFAQAVPVVTQEWIVGVVAGVLALVLELVPAFRRRWEVLGWEAKRFAWLLGCLAAGSVPFLLGCLAARLGLDVGSATLVGSCTVDGLAGGLQVAFLAYFASQAVHGATHGVEQLMGGKSGG
jgi:hypothetical protein